MCRDYNMSEEENQKIKACKKNQIRGMPHENLQQRLEQIVEHMKKNLRKIRS